MAWYRAENGNTSKMEGINMTSCEYCKHAFCDPSVGCVECECEDISEDEIVKYYENAEDGCPHYESD